MIQPFISFSLDDRILPRNLEIRTDDHTVRLEALVCCQNPTLNPMQLVAAIQKYLPELAPDFASCRRREVYDEKETVFR